LHEAVGVASVLGNKILTAMIRRRCSRAAATLRYAYVIAMAGFDSRTSSAGVNAFLRVAYVIRYEGEAHAAAAARNAASTLFTGEAV